MVIAPDFVAVIDGSTSKSETIVHPPLSNGQYAMQLVADALTSMPAQVNVRQFCHFITTTIEEAYHYHGIDRDRLLCHPEERLTASAAIYSRYHRQTWLIGDCQCLVDGKHYDNPKPAEQPNAEKRAARIEQLLRQGVTQASLLTHDYGRDHILDDIIESTHFQNKTFSVIDGFPIPLSLVKIIDCRAAQEIVLATDGYPELLPTLSASEHRLAQLLEEDPLCYRRFKATKAKMLGQQSFDDRAYVRFRTK